MAGKSGAGKTSLALQMAQEFAEDSSHSILFLSLEMKGWELVARLFCALERVDYRLLRLGVKPPHYEQREKHFKDFLKKADFEICEYGYTFAEVEKIIREGYRDKKPDVIFLDFIQLVEWKNFKDQRLAFMEYIRKLKELAKRENIGVVVVSQVRRLPSGADYNRPPDITDLLGSGSLEQTADVVLIVYYRQEGDEERQYFIHLAKNRHGETLKKPVVFFASQYRFWELTGGAK